MIMCYNIKTPACIYTGCYRRPKCYDQLVIKAQIALDINFINGTQMYQGNVFGVKCSGGNKSPHHQSIISSNT